MTLDLYTASCVLHILHDAGMQSATLLTLRLSYIRRDLYIIGYFTYKILIYLFIQK